VEANVISLLRALKTLPPEIRHKIYRYLAAEGGPTNNHLPVLQQWNQFSIYFADHPGSTRSYHTSTIFGGLYLLKRQSPSYASVEDQDNRSWDSRNTSVWHLHRGLFEAVESDSQIFYNLAFRYENFLRFAYSLVELEDVRLSGQGSWILPGNDEVSVLRDFIKWLWEELVLDISRPDLVSPLSPLIERSTDIFLQNTVHWFSKNITQYIRLKNLSITINLTRNSDCWLPGGPQRYEKPLTKLFRLINKNLASLNTLTIFLGMLAQVTLQPQQRHILDDPYFLPWLPPLRSVKVARKFDVQLMLAYEPGTTEQIDPAKKHSLQMKWQEKMKMLMMPYSLASGTTLDVPENLGLELLFEGET